MAHLSRLSSLQHERKLRKGWGSRSVNMSGSQNPHGVRGIWMSRDVQEHTSLWRNFPTWSLREEAEPEEASPDSESGFLFSWVWSKPGCKLVCGWVGAPSQLSFKKGGSKTRQSFHLGSIKFWSATSPCSSIFLSTFTACQALGYVSHIYYFIQSIQSCKANITILILEKRDGAERGLLPVEHHSFCKWWSQYLSWVSLTPNPTLNQPSPLLFSQISPWH